MTRILILTALLLTQSLYALPSMNRSDWEVITSKEAINNSTPVEKAKFDSNDILYFTAGTNFWQTEPLNAPNFNTQEVDLSSTNIQFVWGWDIINDTLWVGGSSGKIWFRTPTNVWDSLPTRPYANQPVRGFSKASDGTLWVGTGHGTYTYSNETWTRIYPEATNVSHFIHLENNDVWLGGSSLSKWKSAGGSKKYWTRDPINMALDSNLKLWVTWTDLPGIEREDKIVQFNPEHQGYKWEQPLGLYADSNGYMWLGGWNDIGIWDTDTNLIAYTDSIAPEADNTDKNDLAHIITDSQGDLWAVGIYIYKYNGTAHHLVVSNSSSEMMSSSSSIQSSSSEKIDAVYNGVSNLDLVEAKNSWILNGLSASSSVKIIFAGGHAQPIDQSWENNQLVVVKPKLSASKAWLYIKDGMGNSQIVPVTLQK
jgi:ligand-binding sensor domain-containing protein